jgi:hypothetical protein
MRAITLLLCMMAVSACQSSSGIAERYDAEDDKNCRSIGLTFGTLEYAGCRMRLAQVHEIEAAGYSGRYELPSHH